MKKYIKTIIQGGGGIAWDWKHLKHCLVLIGW